MYFVRGIAPQVQVGKYYTWYMYYTYNSICILRQVLYKIYILLFALGSTTRMWHASFYVNLFIFLTGGVRVGHDIGCTGHILSGSNFLVST